MNSDSGVCCYPGAEQGVEDVVGCGLSSPLQDLGQEQELKHKGMHLELRLRTYYRGLCRRCVSHLVVVVSLS